jgi:hypothetical protein
VIEAPDGSAATFDFERTRRAYEDPGIGDSCECAGCRNFRSAWRPDYFEASMLSACQRLGIDPRKAFETVIISTADDLVGYVGDLPFYGDLVSQGTRAIESGWYITSCGFGTTAFDGGLVQISFFTTVPWVLPEPNPYTKIDDPI